MRRVPAARLPGFPERFPVRDDDRKPMRYRIVSLLSRAGLRAMFGDQLHIEGGENLPAQGPVVVVSNHLSNIDPFIFGGFSTQTMFCMAKRELFRPRLLAWVIGGCNCFPVDRGRADRNALRVSLDVLRRGGRLLIFVEGTRARGTGMKRAEAGVGFLIRRSGAPVLPVAIWGTERALARTRLIPRRVPVRMRYGKPLPAAALASGDSDDDRALADAAAALIADLLPPEYRGVYGSNP
jgi:1-acyl-sn-glycerol-3-phosphate acyltransferase